MGIEEGEEKVVPIQVQEASRAPKKIWPNNDILSLKQQAHRIEKEYWRLKERKNQ
jgi:hypothetical protein